MIFTPKYFRLIILMVILFVGCSGDAQHNESKSIRVTNARVENAGKPATVKSENQGDSNEGIEDTKTNSYKVTFIELGSVGCIPCRMMQPVMEEVEKRYGDQVNVVFYDVRTPEGNPYAVKYNIRLIPTQIFLDKDGKEYFRHEGYFPFEELVKVLKQKGV
jgi:thioredoxin 1